MTGSKFELIFMGLIFLSSHVLIAQDIEINKINNLSLIKKTDVSIINMYSVSGKVLNINDTSDINVQLIWKDDGAEGWRVLEPVMVIRKNKRIANWVDRKIRFSKYDLKNHRIHLFAAITIENNLLAPNVVYDFNTIKGRIIASSKTVSIMIEGEKTIENSRIDPNVRITMLNEKPIDFLSLNEVGLKAAVAGECKDCFNKNMKLVVEPISGMSRWVQERDPQCVNGSWKSEGYFGRKGMDLWEKYVFYIVVTDINIPNKRYETDEWNNVKKHIVDKSNLVYVQRVEPIPDPNKINIEIKRVAKQNVEINSEIDLFDDNCVVQGKIIGRSPLRDERVWLFTRIRWSNNENGWLRKGKAIFPQSDIWKTPPLSLGTPGQNLVLLAVLSNSIPVSPTDDRVLAISDPVSIRVEEQNDINIVISEINEIKVVSNGVSVKSSDISIAGYTEGRRLGPSESILLLKKVKGKKNGWESIDKAIVNQNGTWRTLNESFGDEKETYIIMAVLTDYTLDKFDFSARNHVNNVSKPVEININNL